MSKVLYLDFEFCNVTEEKVKLVSCVTLCNDAGIKDWWLFEDKEKQSELKKYLSQYSVLVCWSAVAEARSLISLGLNPLNFEWEDLFLEYRLVTNHNDELQYGKHYINGKVLYLKKPKPKYEQDEEEEEETSIDGLQVSGHKINHSLAEAQYKFLGALRDTEHKEAMRNLIISGGPFSVTDTENILKYNREDVTDLPVLKEKLMGHLRSLSGDNDHILTLQIRKRGQYAAVTALRESRGYPIDYEKTLNFSNSVANIMLEVQAEINGLFPDIKPFRWDKKNTRYSWNTIRTKEWIRSNHNLNEWDKTDKGDISLSLDAWSKFYSFRHDYPKDNFGAQIVRFLKLKQSLYGFVPTIEKKKKTFWDYVGSDQRVRPYMNIYGAQSGRSQPSSSSFMFLKPAWMRSLVMPKPGWAMAGIDYSSQEFLISALMAEDNNMIKAYQSGDVYLAFGKQAGAIPQDGTKEKFKKKRDLFKATVLGLSYLMSKYGLSRKLTADTGVLHTTDQAQEMIDKFYEVYSGLQEWQDSIQREYKDSKFIKIYDGWAMWGDNDNFRSVGNVPVQGTGAAIMRAADIRAMSSGLYVPFTLHDALYLEYKVGEEEKIQELYDIMREEFAKAFKSKLQPLAAKLIRMDPFAWSSSYEKDSEFKLKSGLVVPCSNLYVDERAHNDFEKFSPYFNKPPSEIL